MSRRRKPAPSPQQELPLQAPEPDPLPGWLARLKWHLENSPVEEPEEDDGEPDHAQ